MSGLEQRAGQALNNQGESCDLAITCALKVVCVGHVVAAMAMHNRGSYVC